MSRGLRPPILKFSFQNPLSCNIKRHRTLCYNSTGGFDLGGYVLGVSSGLATDGGSDPGAYVRQSCPSATVENCEFCNIVRKEINAVSVRTVRMYV